MFLLGPKANDIFFFIIFFLVNFDLIIKNSLIHPTDQLITFQAFQSKPKHKYSSNISFIPPYNPFYYCHISFINLPEVDGLVEIVDPDVALVVVVLTEVLLYFLDLLGELVVLELSVVLLSLRFVQLLTDLLLASRAEIGLVVVRAFRLNFSLKVKLSLSYFVS